MTLIAATVPTYDATDRLLDACNRLGVTSTLEGRWITGIGQFRFSVVVEGRKITLTAGTREAAARKLWLELLEV